MLKPSNTYIVHVLDIRWQLGRVRVSLLGSLEVEEGDSAASIFALARIMWPAVSRARFALEGFHEKAEFHYQLQE
jgi:hypothetical protein